MKQCEIKELEQLTGLAYKCSFDERFTVFHPTEIFTGAIIANNNSQSRLERLINPFSTQELKNTLKKAGRLQILDSKGVLSLKPCDDKASFSREYDSVVESMSKGGETVRHSVGIINVRDPMRFNSSCTCGKSKKRFIKSIWSPIVRNEWKIPLNGIKYYQTEICPHVWATIFATEEKYFVRVLGESMGFDVHEWGQHNTWIKPYLLSYIEILKKAPKLPNLAIDYVFTYYSNMFDLSKAYLNQGRRQNGLNPIRMYDDPVVKYDILQKFIGSHPRNTLEECIRTVFGV